MTWEAVPVGESAVVVRFGEDIDIELNRRALTADAAIRRAALTGVTETAPALASVLVRFDPELTTAGLLAEQLERELPDIAEQPTRDVIDVPIRYGGTDGPDLARVADLRGCSPHDVVSDHAALELSVLMIGFAPGFAYCGIADSTWDIPRAETVTPEVPAGSVLVAVRQTALAATPVPTGWHCIGRTSVELFDMNRSEPSLLAPGTRLRFVIEEGP